jgi:hypothetical protein
MGPRGGLRAGYQAFDCTTTLFASLRCLSDGVARKVKQNPRPFA